MLYCSSECGSISIMQLLILQTLLCSEVMRRTDLTASLNFKCQSTFDQFEVEHTNARCHLKSDFVVYSRHVCNISWAFYFNRRLMINSKSDAKTLARCYLNSDFGVYIADTLVIFLELSILFDIWSMWSWKNKRSLPFEVGLWRL